MTQDSQSYPSLPEQAKNLAKFSFEVIKTALAPSSQSFLVSSEVCEERMNICRSCEYYDEKQNRCRNCGCFLEQKVKISIDTCPLRKWSSNKSMKDYEDILAKTKEPKKSKGPQFPPNPILGELYTYEDQEWQYDGSIWRIVSEK